ncbi:hypothetical protein LC085_04815 [Bacillus tianshenii]|uniref:hypothetical protein n=1 Tax=Sutcliffiella tianshenii TaxID=1463404 RepID=UPI001CD794E6|nr:hypothetical protein [Bacillus tianshenii]MCA1319228.1 hypothetical protein [Bacillus tianshenii]
MNLVEKGVMAMDYKKENEHKLTNQAMYLWKNDQEKTVQGFLLFPENIPDIQYIKKLLRHIYMAKETIKMSIWFEGDVIQITGRIQSFRYKANRLTIKDIDKNIYHIRIFDVVEIIRRSQK